MPAWEVFPFEASDLRVKSVISLAEEEPRMGEPGGPESSCRGGSDGRWEEIWADETCHPEPGDPDGSGTARLRVNPGQSEV